VLPTLNRDGTRRWIRPRLFAGRFFRRRRALAWTLMALFTAIPYLTLNGKPLVLLDVVQRRFTLFGTTFLPTDSMLLMLLLVGIFLGHLPAHRGVRPRVVRLGVSADGLHGVPLPADRAASSRAAPAARDGSTVTRSTRAGC
jgi:hypothetical protein